MEELKRPEPAPPKKPNIVVRLLAFLLTLALVLGAVALVAFRDKINLDSLKRYITYRTGDLFFTGTPAGAGPVERGDVLRATLEGRELLNFEIP